MTISRLVVEAGFGFQLSEARIPGFADDRGAGSSPQCAEPPPRDVFGLLRPVVRTHPSRGLLTLVRGGRAPMAEGKSSRRLEQVASLDGLDAASEPLTASATFHWNWRRGSPARWALGAESRTGEALP